ncbi:MAG: ion transporter [Bacteroidia bacterium]
MSFKERIHEVIFEADTPAGKLFDVVLLLAIVASVLIIMLESVKSIDDLYDREFKQLEWSFTILFTLEYVLRIYAIKKPWKYIFSFYGIIDLLSILPTYLGLVVAGNTEGLLVIRSIRLIRVFRVLKLTRFLGEANNLGNALMSSRRKILVFLMVVVMVTIITGTFMYLIEGAEHGFDSIPKSIYWAIVTLTTVGYGDISPETTLGQFFASIIMIMGYGIIAVPTGIVSAELAKQPSINNTQSCHNCGEDSHDDKAKYCHQCGEAL